MKLDDVKIVQIDAVKSLTSGYLDARSKTEIYGLGDDGKVYEWNYNGKDKYAWISYP